MDYLNASPPVLRDYLVYLETILGRSPNTVNEYYLDLRTFFRFLLQKRGLVSPPELDFDAIHIDAVDLELLRSVTRADVLDFLVFAARQRPKYHTSPATPYGNDLKTRARKISALRGLYKYYCSKLQLIEENPTQSLDTPKPRKELPKYLTLQESLDLLEVIDGPNRERDYCIITLFLNCGMRVSELVGIDLQDISEDRLRESGLSQRHSGLSSPPDHAQRCQPQCAVYQPAGQPHRCADGKSAGEKISYHGGPFPEALLRP